MSTALLLVAGTIGGFVIAVGIIIIAVGLWRLLFPKPPALMTSISLDRWLVVLALAPRVSGESDRVGQAPHPRAHAGLSMKLKECTPGDIVAITWPRDAYDNELSETEQLVQVSSILGGHKRGTQTHSVMVRLVDRESLAVMRFPRALAPDIEVIDIVERSRHRRSDEQGDARDGDALDPLQSRRQL